MAFLIFATARYCSFSKTAYLPKTGDTFAFLSGFTNADPLDGTQFAYAGAAPGFLFDVANAGRLVALNDAVLVPEPATYALLAVGLGVLLVRGRSARNSG